MNALSRNRLRLTRLLVLAVAAALIVSATATSRATDPPPPNIVVFLVDDMGVMDSSLPSLVDEHGQPKRYPLNDFYRTPNMERLGALGIRFSTFYAMSVCSPTRIAIMTGQNATRHHTTNWINPDKNNSGPYGPPDWNWHGLTPDDVTIPALLRNAGYRTIHVGKGHFGTRNSPGGDPSNLGFEVNVAGASIGAPGSYYGAKNFGLGERRSSHAVPHLDKYHGQDIFLTEALTIEAKARVSEAVQSGMPFYLYFAHYAVHSPFESDPRFAAHYKDSGKPANVQAFGTLIEGMDKSLGDMLDHLEDLGVAENTLVIFLGDNGSDARHGKPHEVACAAPLRGMKGAHYEGGMRVPFIAAWAKPQSGHPHQERLPIPAATIQTQLGSVCDLFPTILDVVGVDAPEDHTVDGAPLQALLTGESDPGRSETFLMHYPHSVHRSDYFTTWRNGDWKVIYHFYPSEASENSHYQLYNLAEDMSEQTNLAVSQPDQLRRMVAELAAELDRHNAQYPVDDFGTPLAVKQPD